MKKLIIKEEGGWSKAYSDFDEDMTNQGTKSFNQYIHHDPLNSLRAYNEKVYKRVMEWAEYPAASAINVSFSSFVIKYKKLAKAFNPNNSLGMEEYERAESVKMLKQMLELTSTNGTYIPMLKVVYQYLSGIDNIRTHGVPYTDPHSGNIGLDRQGNLLFFDFGTQDPRYKGSNKKRIRKEEPDMLEEKYSV